MRFLHEHMRKIGMVWYIIWYIKFNMYTLCFCKCHIWQNYCSHPQAVIKFAPNQSNYSFRLKQGSSKLIHSWFKFFCIHIEVWKKLKQYIFGSDQTFPRHIKFCWKSVRKSYFWSFTFNMKCLLDSFYSFKEYFHSKHLVHGFEEVFNFFLKEALKFYSSFLQHICFWPLNVGLFGLKNCSSFHFIY